MKVPRRFLNIAEKENTDCEMYRNIRVKYIRKRKQLHFASKITPSTNTLSAVTPNRSLLTPTFSIAVIDRSTENTSNLLSRNIRKRKKYVPHHWCFCIILLAGLLLLAIIATFIYLLIHLHKPSTKIIPAILRWNSTGETIAGTGHSSGQAAHQLHYPHDLVIDSLNTLYIADLQNNRIQKWLYKAQNGTTVAGQSDCLSGSNASYLKEPGGVHLDSNDNLYVADRKNFRIQLWEKNAISGKTVVGTGISGSANDQLQDAYHVIYDESSDTLYVSDYDEHRVMSYKSGILMGTVVAGNNGAGFNTNQLKQPIRFVLDSITNSLIIANYAAHNIIRWTLSASNWQLIAGSMNGTPTTLNGPIGVTLDPMGNIYVADAINARIQMFSIGDNLGTTICGILGSPGWNSSQLNSPYSVRFDNQLNLYVADTGNHRIQKFSRY